MRRNLVQHFASPHVNLILSVACVATILIAMVPATTGANAYDPWCDVNNDGVVNVLDLIKVAGVLGSSGKPVTKAGVSFDSGWINITDLRGQMFTVTHSLNIQNWNNQSILVDIMGKETLTSVIQRLGSGTICFEKTYGRSSMDAARSVVKTGDGGYAMAGYASWVGHLDYDIWLVKVDEAGNIQWNKTYGGTGRDEAISLVQTNDGGYALAGITTSFGAGSEDMWLVKTDPVGNAQWNRTYGGTQDDEAWSLVQTNDGGYGLGGWTFSFGNGERDFYLVKTDGAGNMQWSRTFGGTSYDRCHSLIQTIDGGYALTGDTNSYGAGGEDVWLIKTDGSGNMQWNKTYGGTGAEEAYRISQISGGGYVFAGTTGSFGSGGLDMWLVKIDGAGSVQWNRTYGKAGADQAFSFVQTDDGGYALGGYTNSPGDMWLVRTDAAGNMQWNRTYGGSDSDTVYAIVQTNDGGYALAGTTYSFGAGYSDFYLVKTDASGNAGQSSSPVVVVFWGLTIMKLYRDPMDFDWNYVRIRISITK